MACYTNLSVVFAWLSFPLPVVYIISAIFCAFLVFFSIYTSKPFLSFSYTFSKVNRTTRKRKYYTETVVIPFLLACIVILVYTKHTYPPPNFYILNEIYLICIGLSLAISFLIINITDMKTEEVLRYKNLQAINPALFVVFMLVLIFFTAIKGGFFLPF